MDKGLFTTPVLFLIYNRPEHTQEVFAMLRLLKPTRLFVAADGPRETIAFDVEKCAAARAVITAVDWDCKVETLYREKNRSTKFAVPEAIDWFFSMVNEGIILEDDCVPDPSFFIFCEEMLSKYKSDERIMHINGTNFLKGKTFHFKGSYYFSRLCHPWGWATWKRAWDQYNFDLKGLDEFIREDKLTILTPNSLWRKYYYDFLLQTRAGKIDCWDFQWFYTVWSQAGLVITPVVNLVSNIGFGKDATNTHYKITKLSRMKKGSIDRIVPLNSFEVNTAADQYALSIKTKEGKGNIFQKVNQKIRIIFRKTKQN